MTLWDFLKKNKKGIDTFDDTFDECVTVVYSDEKDDHAKFVKALCSKVMVSSGHIDYVSWSGLIERNFDKFNAFATKYWMYEYKDRSEYICQWIKELHNYCSGNIPESYYPVILKFVETLKGE